MKKLNIPLGITGLIVLMSALWLSMNRQDSYWLGILQMLLMILGMFIMFKAWKKS